MYKFELMVSKLREPLQCTLLSEVLGLKKYEVQGVISVCAGMAT
jgi:hypothetical protein